MEKKLSKLEVDCESIRNSIKECGKLYISIAYKVYELDYYEIYKEKYDNIIDCCAAEFGFKRSTVYNMIGIVVKFGEKEKNGTKITYSSLLKYNKFSYSQLTEMLSLSDSQREKITPDTTIKEIRNVKKVQTSGKNKNSVISETPKTIEKTSEPHNNVIEVPSEQLKPVEETQNNEKQFDSDSVLTKKYASDLAKQQLELYNNDVERTILELLESERRAKFSQNHFRNQVEELIKENTESHSEFEKKLRAMLEQRDAFREQVLKSKETIEEQNKTIENYYKENRKLIERNSILETDNQMLKEKIKHLEKRLAES